jgi:hypothetical protein
LATKSGEHFESLERSGLFAAAARQFVPEVGNAEDGEKLAEQKLVAAVAAAAAESGNARNARVDLGPCCDFKNIFGKKTWRKNLGVFLYKMLLVFSKFVT